VSGSLDNNRYTLAVAFLGPTWHRKFSGGCHRKFFGHPKISYVKLKRLPENFLQQLPKTQQRGNLKLGIGIFEIQKIGICFWQI
jgi:hypothetical protein